MHIVSTNPIAIAWGEDANSAPTGDPGLDMGYTVLPLPIEWIDIALEVDKTANPNDIMIGQTSVFTIVIKVPVTAEAPVTDIDLVDELPPGWNYVSASPTPDDVSGQTITWSTYDWDLNPGETQIITITAQATAGVDTSEPNRNVATATGNSLGVTLVADDDAFVEIIEEGPGLSITKYVWDGDSWEDANTATGPALLGSAGDVQYRVVVTNIGNVDLTDITVTDSDYGTITIPGLLTVGSSTEETYSISWAAGQQVNTATASVTVDENTYTDSDPAYYIGVQAGINVVKTADKTEAFVGETVQYTYEVTNTGTVQLYSITLIDSVTGNPIYQSGDDGDNILQVDETWVYTDSYIIQEGDSNPLENTATVQGYAYGIQFTDTDTWEVDILELDVTKTADTSYTRTYDWTITKSVDPASWNFFTGGSGTSTYTIAVTKDAGTDSDWSVSGTITIHNPAGYSVTIHSVSDSVSGVGAATITDPLPVDYVLAAGDTVELHYTLDLPNGDPRTNTVVVDIAGTYDDFIGTADIVFGEPTDLVRDSITVTDSY